MMKRKYDKVYIGIVAGFFLPIVAFGVLSWIWIELIDMGALSAELFSKGFVTRTIGLLAIGTNLILVRYFQNRYAYQALRGVVIPTFIYVIFWIIYFSSVLL